MGIKYQWDYGSDSEPTETKTNYKKALIFPMSGP